MPIDTKADALKQARSCGRAADSDNADWMADELNAAARVLLVVSDVLAEAETRPTWEEIRRLPSPWEFNDVSRADNHASCWRYACEWCGASRTVLAAEKPDPAPDHPDSLTCLWPRALANAPRAGAEREEA